MDSLTKWNKVSYPKRMEYQLVSACDCTKIIRKWNLKRSDKDGWTVELINERSVDDKDTSICNLVVNKMSNDPDSEKVITAITLNYNVSISNSKTLEKISEFGIRRGHPVAISPDGQFIASCSTIEGNFNCMIYDKFGQEVQTIGHNNISISAIAFSSDGNKIAIAYDDITIWTKTTDNNEKYEFLCRLYPPSKNVSQNPEPWVNHIETLLFTPDCKQLVSIAGFIREINVWNVESGQEQSNHNRLVYNLGWQNLKYVETVAISADSKIMAIGSIWDLLFWDIPNNKLLKRITNENTANSLLEKIVPIKSISFSDKGIMTSASSNGQITVWNLEKFEAEITFDAHDGAIFIMDFV